MTTNENDNNDSTMQVEETTTTTTETTTAAAAAAAVDSFGWTDEEFQNWLQVEFEKDPLYTTYQDIFDAAPKCIVKWRQRYRGNKAVWRRLFQKDRVMKEFLEAVPILDSVQQLIQHSRKDIQTADGENDQTTTFPKYTIIDLASGRGYLSMILSELLPPDSVERFVLVDKFWPMHGTEPQPNHISFNHIYGEYFKTWPIPLCTSKQDLKKGRNLRYIETNIIQKAPGPVILLAVHLCGILSLRAVDIFHNSADKIQLFCLKPCCLPGMIHAERKEIFQIGNHSFDSKEVCIHGKWNKDKWKGPNRQKMKVIFDKWAYHLGMGIKGDNIQSLQAKVMVQRDGGYQNEFLFAERYPICQPVWDKLHSANDRKEEEEAIKEEAKEEPTNKVNEAEPTTSTDTAPSDDLKRKHEETTSA